VVRVNVRENWRIVLLVVFVLASSVALFAPLATGSGTGLEYGLELSGGTQIRAPLVGWMAEDVSFEQGQDLSDLRNGIADDLNVESTAVRFRPEIGTVEVFSENVSGPGALASALNSNGFDVAESDVSNAVSEPTRTKVVNVLNNKINQGGLTGGGASISRSGTGENFVVVEVPNANRSEVVRLIEGTGEVNIVARFPVERNGTTTYKEKPLLTNADFRTVGNAQSPDRTQPSHHVDVTLFEEPARNYSNAMQSFGFTSGQGIENCPVVEARRNPDNATGYCLITTLNDEVVDVHQMGRGLAQEMNQGNFANSPTFIMTATNMSDAQRLAISLNAGSLPTSLDFDRGTTYFLEASQGEEFKFLSLIAGLVAWLAVSGVVFVRYGSPRVAVPMLATAGAEVFLLLGFASAIGLALDLSHIAGFIAVIGTGVDDLIIIADEILQEGKVATGRVFQSRFRKAFWVIGAAAATTIVAMSPLMVLSLGDLTGFAIVTIVGVLIGVLITRPAYGDVLRRLMIDED
jgi:preprotein translocase subunit SecD